MIAIDRDKIAPYQTHFWGQDCTCDPRLVERVLGDGNVLIGLQPLNTRPHYYLIRVDSSWHLNTCRTCVDDCPDYLTEHLDEIYDAIEEEYGSIDAIRESNRELREGEAPDSTDWPVFDYESGASWFALNAAQYAPEFKEVRG